MCLSVCVHAHACAFVCTLVCAHVYTCKYNVCMYMWVCVCTGTCMYTYHVYLFINIVYMLVEVER